jgi:AbrB family looped-hinge helix DNA binding protein
MKPIARVTGKGQVVLPKPVREQLRWVSGTQLAVEILDEGAVRLTPLAAEDPIDLLYGCLKDLPGDPVADLEAEHRTEIAAVVVTAYRPDPQNGPPISGIGESDGTASQKAHS